MRLINSKSGFASIILLLVGVAILSILLVLNLENVSTQLLNAKSSLQNLQGIKKGQIPSLDEEVSKTQAGQKEVNITASFEIYTKGTKRDFSASMYHNLSPDVYITSPNPSIVYIKKEAVTWNDFFKTLPMQLTPDCLVTGTKETFCSGIDGVLKFYLNNEENPGALYNSIKEGDKLKVTFISI